ncbi:MAG: hypothetical protein GXO98_07865 [Nitrospirae bacterium]|nr:hypothetical protein [Nitrospirota bacterium]
MLRMLRKKMRAILIVTILIIIPAFIGFYGVGRYRGRNRQQSVIAKVNGQKISYRQFYDTYQKIKESQQTIYGKSRLSEENEKQLNKAALEQLIKKHILQREAKRRHIKVSDKEVLREIESYTPFQKDGKFDRDRYLRVMQFNRINPKQFEEGIRNDLRIRKLLRQVVEGAIVSGEEMRKEYVRRNAKVRVKYLLFKTETFKKDITVDKKEIEEYFQAHKQEFKIPDRVNVEYIMVRFKPKEIEVKEKEIVDYYREHPERYKKEGSEKTSSKAPSLIPLKEVRAEIKDTLTNQKAEDKAREEAEGLASNLFDIAAWKAMVKEKGLKVKETGFFARGEAIKDIGWAPDFVEEAFSLEKDEVSSAVQTPKGYAIFIVKEKSAAHLPRLEEVKAKVEEKVRYEKAKALARTKALECLRKLKEGNSFEETAKEFSLKVKDSGLFTQGGYIEGIGLSSPFATAAFSLQQGKISPVVEVSLGFVILKEEEKKGIDEKKFASEAEELRKELLPWKQMGIYNKWYRALRKDAKIWIDPNFEKQL